jgi:hypothetical protein
VLCITEFNAFVFRPDRSHQRRERIQTCRDCLIEFVEAVSPGACRHLSDVTELRHSAVFLQPCYNSLDNLEITNPGSVLRRPVLE